MVQDPELLPHYAWLFPESEDRANIGVCMDVGKMPSNRIRQTLDRMAESYFASALRGAERGRMRVAPIKCSVWPSDLAEPGLWIAGEAAGLANWSTGEGIAQGIRSGMLVGRAASHFSESGEEQCRKLYEASVKSVLGPGLMGALGVRFAVMANVFELLTLIPARIISGLGGWTAARLVAAK
jgi:flavin-dependent dehydrogenase